ncbi:MAG: hypothetical protein J2P51_08845 [Hyphomicrobiaceae bacterium]|nr:hypothetical protein [Hyphomicrobiaceae bacterium]
MPDVAFDESGHYADDLGIGGEPAKCLFGAGHTFINADLKEPAPGAQCHRRIWPSLTDACDLAAHASNC